MRDSTEDVPLATDVQAALTVIGRRHTSNENQFVRVTNLVGAHIPKADLASPDLSDVNLSGADLPRANLTSANLSANQIRVAPT